MHNFILGVLSSLVAGVLLLAGGWLRSRSLRQWLMLGLSHISSVGIIRFYRTQQEANRDLSGDLARARWVRVLAGRGNELTRDSFTSVWRDAGGRLETIEILLPDPNCGASSWLAKREAENASHDKGYDGGLLADQVRGNIEYILNSAGHNKSIALRLYDLPSLCRIVATDEIVYFTPYSGAVHGRNSPCLVYRKSSPMYDFALRVFSTTWSVARVSIKQEDNCSVNR